MYKMIVGWWLICIGSIVAMDNIDIRLKSLHNQSGRNYVVIYGPGHQCFLANGNRVDVNYKLFTNAQSLPIAEKIVFQEDLPFQYLLATGITMVLDIKAFENLSLKITGNALQEKTYAIKDRSQYVLNVIINQNNVYVDDKN